MKEIKRSLLGLVTLLVVLAGITLARAQDFVRVKRPIDGDTIMLKSGERVNLIGVDTLGTKDPRKPVERFGKETAAFRQGMAAGKRDEPGVAHQLVPTVQSAP